MTTNPRSSYDDNQPVTHGTSGSDRDLAQDARTAGKDVAQDAKASGEHVAETAREEVRNVSSTVGEQARTLLHEASSEFGSQAGTQQQRLAEGLRSLSQEFGSMAEGSDGSSSQATGLVRDASQRTQDLADWLEQHGPGDVLEEVKQFARRKPGTFIAVAAGVGLLAGRLTRGLADDGDQDPPAATGEAAGTRASSMGSGMPSTTGSYAAPAASVGGSPGSGSPTMAPPVGAGPVDPGPMSGIGAGPAEPFPAPGRGTAAGPGAGTTGGTAPGPVSGTTTRPGSGTSGLDDDDLSVHGEDPR